MWRNNTYEGVVKELGEAIANLEVQAQETNMTDNVCPLHRFNDDIIPDVRPHGHHHKTIQYPHRYRQLKTAKNRKREKAARKARKRNRR